MGKDDERCRGDLPSEHAVELAAGENRGLSPARWARCIERAAAATGICCPLALGAGRAYSSPRLAEQAVEKVTEPGAAGAVRQSPELVGRRPPAEADAPQSAAARSATRGRCWCSPTSLVNAAPGPATYAVPISCPIHIHHLVREPPDDDAQRRRAFLMVLARSRSKKPRSQRHDRSASAPAGVPRPGPCSLLRRQRCRGADAALGRGLGSRKSPSATVDVEG